MKRIYWIFALMFVLGVIAGTVSADDDIYTTRVNRFGRGYIIQRSNGATEITQPFGRGFISRETSFTGDSTTYIGRRFGRGYLIQKSTIRANIR